jgi:hypothetical protein
MGTALEEIIARVGSVTEPAALPLQFIAPARIRAYSICRRYGDIAAALRIMKRHTLIGFLHEKP